MPLHLSDIDPIVRLYALPFADENEQNGARHSRLPAGGWQVARRDLNKLWREWVIDTIPTGYSLDLAQFHFDYAWKGQEDEISLLAFYRNLADTFLEPAGDHLRLSLDGEGLGLGLGRADRALFWNLLCLRIGPDLLPALRVAFLPPAIADSLLANDIPVDEVTDQGLARLLDRGEGVVDCHLHSGSAFRYELLWTGILDDAENTIMKSGLPLANLPDDKHKALVKTLRPSLLYCLLARRILDFAVSDPIGSWREVVDGIDAKVARLHQDSPPLRDLAWMHDHLLAIRTAFERAGREPRPEPAFLVNVIRALVFPPRHLIHEASRLSHLWSRYLYHKAKVYRFLTQGREIEGLSRFRQIFGGNALLNESRWRDTIRDLRQRKRHLAPLEGITDIEIRLSPGPGYVYDLARYASEPDWTKNYDAPGLAIVVHFLKDLADRDKPTYQKMTELHRQMRDLQEVAEICSREGMPDKIVGIDVAGGEMDAPNWLYLPIFVEFRRYWRRTFPERPPGYTYHAGEDFLHLAQGLRHIGEIVEFFPWENGDRIGHGLALGISPEKWRFRHPVVIAPVEVQLFDRIWEWRVILKNRLACAPHTVHRLESDIISKGRLLLDNFAVSMSCHQWALFYEGLFSPAIITELLDRPVRWEGEAEYRRQASDEIRRDSQVLDALRVYLDKRHKPPPAARLYQALGPPDEEAQRYSAIQEWLITKIARRGFVVEACPTSNVSIGSMGSLAEHPLIDLMKKINILICTDNVSTFNSPLRNEYGRIFSAMREQAGPSDDPLQAISRLMENSRRYSFIH